MKKFKKKTSNSKTTTFNFGKKSNRSLNNHAKNMRSIAFKMGLVQRGLDNGDTQVAAAFNAGKQNRERVSKKPLY